MKKALTSIVAILFLFTLSFSQTPKYKDSFILKGPSSGDVITKNLPLTLELNFWNIARYEGDTWMAFYKEEDTVEYYADIKNIVLKDKNSWVHGYPEVYYGYKPWAAHGTSIEKLVLPKKVSEFPDVLFNLKYNVWYERNLPINFAMETWITKDLYQKTVNPGDIEMMVWLYANKLSPAGKKVAEVKIPIIINGNQKDITWEVYFSPMSWDYVAYKSKENIIQGKVKIPIKNFLKHLRTVIANNSSRITVEKYDQMYVNVWEIGTEFGDPYTTEAKFGWTFSNFEIETR
ncbi:MAG: GH12 family glycosyl hydrolase domain-containing protein [Dictyoglomaceae bacterium]